MTTGYNNRSRSNFGIPGLKSGYDADSSPTVNIPSVGVEDVDKAMFTLFDKEIPFQVTTEAGQKKVPVIFAAGEKWASIKKGIGLRDKSGSLILPLITIVRTAITQDGQNDLAGRGMRQHSGEIIVRRRLDGADRSYQNLRNRLFMRNQVNVAVTENDDPIAGQLITRGTVGELASDPVVAGGGLLVGDLKNNVYETIVVPSPQFYTATYEITFWTQYTQQMNALLEQTITSFLPQVQGWRLDTLNGYWFVAMIDAGQFGSENNVDEMSKDERVIKHKFTIKVPAYLFASTAPGAPIPVKRYVSSPIISFDVGLSGAADLESVETEGVDEPFLGADDPTLPLADGNVTRRDQRRDGSTRLYGKNDSQEDPALTMLRRGHPKARFKKIIGIDAAGKRVVRFVRVTTTNTHTGETVLSPGADLGGLTIVVVED